MKKILIANRGEIAVRIARACADYGVKSASVYADADLDALHTRSSDESHGLGGDTPKETYLNIEKLLAVAARSGADAIHPGYGFLSENANFAQSVIDAGLVWIGPPPEVIACLGDKLRARKVALKVGAPLVAGTAEPVQHAQEVLDFAKEHGFPIIIKATFGGGGRGMKIAWRMDEVRELYESAVREATTAFGRGECFVEQFIDRPRHIEVQVVADQHGHLLALGTRDCSLQRRNQKLVEEAPAPFLSDQQRHRFHQAAQDICAEVGYVGVGTVEFLLSSNGTMSFLEVNTRLQVEHTVTEQTSGIDLVVEQLRIADGQSLSISEAPAVVGHAFEFRINAEDPGRGFLPSPGRLKVFSPPSGPGVRMDAGVTSTSTVSAAFDSLMSKLIVTGATRQQAIMRARRALDEFQIEGVASVLPFHRAVMAHDDFVSEDSFKVHTRWIETEFAGRLTAFARTEPEPKSGLIRAVIEVDGRRVQLAVPAALLQSYQTDVSPEAGSGNSLNTPSDTADSLVKAPVTGVLESWSVSTGSEVREGDVICLMAAMKMEMQICAPRTGRLTHLAETGQQCAAGLAIATVV